MNYVVQPGDTISEIAQRHHQTVFELSLVNHVWYKQEVIKVGQVIIVKPTTTKRDKVLLQAKKLLGLRYVFGGESPKHGMDCSAFTRHVFAKVGIVLPRVSYEQFRVGVKVTMKTAKPGDLIFFSRRGYHVGHVGIVVNAKKKTFIQEGGHRCKISSYAHGSYARRYRGIKRVIQE